jgi:hypothetical protein
MTRSSLFGACATLCALVGVPTAATAAPNQWDVGPSLSVARSFAATATLADGRIMVVGGEENTPGPSKVAELYSSSAGHFTRVSDMGTARQSLVAATLTSGQVLVAGPDQTAEVYDPTTNTWAPTANNAANDHGGTVPLVDPYGITALPDGRALLAGSPTTATTNADLYSPADNKFHAAAPVGTARELAGQALLPGGRVLVAGGANGPAGLASGEVYDPGSDSWTPVSNSMPSEHIDPIMAQLPGGKVLIAGGFAPALAGPPAGTTRAAIYDAATNTFSVTGSMTQPHLIGSGVTLADGRVLDIGGVDAVSGPTTVFTTTDVYYPSTGTWLPAGPLANQLGAGTAAPLPGGGAILAGGTNLSTQGAVTTQIYEPATAPSEPTAVSALAGNGTAVVVWSPPATDGGVPVTGYTLHASNGATLSLGAGTTGTSVTGLPNGQPVTFTITASNVLGTGPAAASAAVTPTAPVTPVTPDTTAPTVKVTHLKSKLKLKSFLKGVTATLTPSEPSSLAIQLVASAKKATVAKAYNLTVATKAYGRSALARKIKLKPSKKLVGKAHKFTVRLIIVAVDAAGNRSTTTKTIKVSG